MAGIVRSVMTEFGACGQGFAINDPEVNHMSRAYGGPGVCELRKMYFLPDARGRGHGRRMLEHCLATARTLGYRRCYLETLTGMDAAMHLYSKAGFKPLCAPLGTTGHSGCDRWFARDL